MYQIKNYSRIIVICGTLLIWIIKFFIRPFHLYTAWLSPFIGVAPNLIGTFLLPFGGYWLLRNFFLMRNNFEVKLTCASGLLLVIIDEYLQLIPLFHRTFDYLDILASFVGIFIGYKVFIRMMFAFSTNTAEENFLPA